MIATSRQSASRTIVPTIRQRLGHGGSAYACLAGSPGIDVNESPTGACSLVSDHRQEHRPSRVVNGLRQHPGGKSLCVQILDGNQPVFVNQFPRELVLEIRPLIAHMNVGTLEQPHGLASPVAALLPSRHLTLTAAQTGLGIPVVPGILNLRAITQYAKLFSPTSIPVARSLVSRGVPSHSTLIHANQRPASRLIVTVLIVPSTGRCSLTLMCPAP